MPSSNLKGRSMYAIHSGDFEGGFLVHFKELRRGNAHAVLIMPDMVPRYVPNSEVQMDLKHKNIRLVRKLPQEVYDVCKANFKYFAEREGIYAN